MWVHFVFLAFVASLVLAIFWRPSVAFAAIVCLFGLKQWTQSQSFWYAMHGTTVNYMMGAVVAFGLIMKMIRTRDLFSVYSRVGWLSISLYLWALISVLWTINFPGWVDNWSRFSAYVLVFMICGPLLFSNLRQINTALLFSLFFASVVMILLLATSRWHGRMIMFANQGLLGYEDLVSGNPLAIGILGGDIILIGMLLNFSGIARFWQIARYPLIAAAIVLILRSGSRGQFFAMILVLAVFLPISRRPRNLGPAIALVTSAAVCLILITVLFNQVAMEKNSTRWSARTITHVSVTRLEYANEMFDLWVRSNPIQKIMGVGNSAAHNNPTVNVRATEVLLPEILTELGLPGLILFILIVWYSARSWVRCYRIVIDDPGARGTVATIGALAAYEFVLSFKEGSLMGASSLFMYLIIVSLLEPIGRRLIVQVQLEMLAWEQSQSANASDHILGAEMWHQEAIAR